MESEAEFTKQLHNHKPSAVVEEKPVVIDNNNSIDLAADECISSRKDAECVASAKDISSCAEDAVSTNIIMGVEQSCNAAEESKEDAAQVEATTINEKTAAETINKINAVPEESNSLIKSANNSVVAEESVSQSSKDNTDIKCTCPKINNTVICGSKCPAKLHNTPFKLASVSDTSLHSTSVSSSVLTKDKSANSVHTYPSTKTPVDGTLTSVTTAPPAESFAQRVTRLLSPNFKLTMTDTIPSVLPSQSFSSLLIGNMGSTTSMRTALTSTSVFPHPVTVRSRAVTRKYPNISLTTIPVEHPLLDHDYCYQNYYEIVQAAAKLSKEKNAKKKAFIKQELKAVNEEGQPVKRKYRTKRVIAEEMKAEAERRAILKLKALDGDEVAQKELDELAIQDKEKEIAARKKNNKKRRESVTVDVENNSEDEVRFDTGYC